MARYQPEHKAETRRRLVDSAVNTFRRDGVESAGLKQIMQELGQTVGGFYRHFSSKSELVQAAVEQGLAQSLALMRSLPDDDRWTERFSAGYLSEAHRRSTARGCVLAALGSDIARSEDHVKQACEAGLREIFAEMRRHLPADTQVSDEALWSLLALEVGGLLLSRMVASEQTAGEILASCRTAVAAALAERPPAKRREQKKTTVAKAVASSGARRRKSTA